MGDGLQKITSKMYKNKSLFSVYLKAISVYSRLEYRYLARYYKPIKVINMDWDYLIVLDACRFDFLSRILNRNCFSSIYAGLSVASNTREWLLKNFDSYFKDVVYVSANPYISNVEYKGFNGSKHFYRVEPIWSYGWNEALGTVHPRTVYEVTLRLVKKYPQHRFIIHFIQPHSPYIGRKGSAIKEFIRKKVGNTKYKEEYIHKLIDFVWEGKIDIYDIIDAYIENLQIVMDYVYRLIDNLYGKVVITSDHGEAFGEKGVFFHPPGIYKRTRAYTLDYS